MIEFAIAGDNDYVMPVVMVCIALSSIFSSSEKNYFLRQFMSPRPVKGNTNAEHLVYKHDHFSHYGVNCYKGSCDIAKTYTEH